MLPKELRLSIPLSRSVYQFGKRVNNSQLQLYVLARAEGANCRWLIQVPKKVIKLAAHRNRIRRMLAVAIVSIAMRLEPTDIIIRVKTPLTGLKTVEVQKLLEEALKKAKLLAEN